MEASFSSVSSNSNISGAAAMRLALALESASASTEATGCPQRSITRDHFCGSIRHMPEVNFAFDIPLREQEFEAPNEQNGKRLGFQRYAIGMNAASISSPPSGTRQRSSFRTAIHSRQVPSSKGAYVWLSSP